MRARVIASFLPCSMVDTCRVAPAERRSKSSSPRDKRCRSTARRREPRRATPSHAEPRRTALRRAAPSHAAPHRAAPHAQPGYSAPRRHRGTAVSKKTTRPPSKPREPGLFRPYVPPIGNRSGIEPPGHRRDMEDPTSINIRRA